MAACEAGVEQEINRRLEVMPTGDPDDETCTTFVLHEEDHTLGNSLRYIIMKKWLLFSNCPIKPVQQSLNVSFTCIKLKRSPDVVFCGYSVPHPSENKINLRIQTNGPPAVDVLRRGLSELTALCEHMLATFETAVEEHKDSKQNGDFEMSTTED